MKGFFGKFAGGTKKEEESKPQPSTESTVNTSAGIGAGANTSGPAGGGMFAGLNTKKKPEPNANQTFGQQQPQQFDNSGPNSGHNSFSDSFSNPSSSGPKKANAFGFINKSAQNQDQQPPIQQDPVSQNSMFGNMTVKPKTQPQMQAQPQFQSQPQQQQTYQAQGTMDLLEFADMIGNSEPEKPVTSNIQDLGGFFPQAEQQSQQQQSNTGASPFGFAKFHKRESQSSNQPVQRASNILDELAVDKDQNYESNYKANDSIDLGDRGGGFGNINESFDKQSAISHHYEDQTLNNTSGVGLDTIDYSMTPTQQANYNVSPKDGSATFGTSASGGGSGTGMFGRFKSKSKQMEPVQDTSVVSNQKMPQLGEKPELTPEKFTLQMKIQITNNLEKLGDIIVEQYNIKQTREAKESEIAELKQRLQYISQRQNDAIENDRFEEADELEKATDQVRHQIKALEEEIDECNIHYTSLDKEAQTLYQEEYETYRNFIDSLEQALYHRNKELSEYIFEGERTQAKDKDYAEREQHSLENSKKDLEFRQKTFEESKKHIDEQMEKQTKESFEEQGRLASKKDNLAEEIKRIKQELALKEAEFSEVSLQLDKVNKQIGYVQKRFEADFLKLKTKEEEVLAIEETYEKKLKTLTVFKERIQSEGEKFQNTVQKNKEIIKELEKLKDEYKSTMTELNRVNKKREQLLELYQNAELEYQRAKIEYRQKEDEVQNLEHEIKTFQGKVSNLMANKGSLSQKLPFLETEKRNYAQARNFKEASRVTNEKNEIQAQITKIEEEIEFFNSKEKANHELIEKIQSEILVSLKYEMEKLKETADENKYHLLGKKLKDLTVVRDHLKNSGMYDNSARIERELENCRAEIKSLQLAYPGRFDKEAEKETEKSITPEKNDHDYQTYTPQTQQFTTTQEYNVPQQQEEETKQEEAHPGESYDLGLTPEELNALDEGTKKIKLSEGLRMHDELEQKIAELDQKIEECTENDRFEEADKLNEEEQELINAKNTLFMLFIRAGYTSTDTLRSYLGE
mmetsp:Transcript_21660/g.25147  ORF Transcript_21660/g.25147 Transcript_21660/m.25147 type:complete len:1028 (-) Transcript_21660:192-3275(-)